MAGASGSSGSMNADFELNIHPSRRQSTSAPKLDPFSSLPLEIKYDLAEFMSYADLARLAGCNNMWNLFSTTVLYKRDAREDNSSAIKWAVMIDYGGGGQEVGIRTIELAIHHHADVNAVHKFYTGDGETGYATALHIAAAMGRIGFCKKLLCHGANVHAFASELCRLPGIVERRMIESKLSNRNLNMAIKRQPWLPLLIPFVLGHENVARLLLKHGATPDLAVGYDAVLGEQNSVTILHVIAASHKRSIVDEGGNCYFKRFKDFINTKLPGVGYPPIHLALQNPYPPTFEKLIAAGADLEVTTTLGRTPLLQAIINCYKTTCPDTRKRHVECIELLLEAGANVNAHSRRIVAETPLLATVLDIPYNWRAVYREVKAIIKLLIRYDADVNERSAAGLTPVHAICREILQRQGNTTSLISVLDDFIEQGGDVNIPCPDGDSILKKAIVDYNQHPGTLLRTILKAGATIQNHEADVLLVKWLQCAPLRSTKKWYDFDVMDHRDHISQGAIDDAYRYAFEVDAKVFEALRSNFPETTIGAELVAKRFYLEKTKLGGAALDLPFDGSYVDENGDNFLHMIVNRLEAFPSYRESTAITEAEMVIENGAKVNHKNRSGMTVLQRLRSMRKEYRDLRLCLHEKKDKQAGEF